VAQASHMAQPFLAVRVNQVPQLQRRQGMPPPSERLFPQPVQPVILKIQMPVAALVFRGRGLDDAPPGTIGRSIDVRIKRVCFNGATGEPVRLCLKLNLNPTLSARAATGDDRLGLGVCGAAVLRPHSAGMRIACHSVNSLWSSFRSGALTSETAHISIPPLRQSIQL
jgi:hypothetical protein